jgi:hypothetical protein
MPLGNKDSLRLRYSDVSADKAKKRAIRIEAPL